MTFPIHITDTWILQETLLLVVLYIASLALYRLFFHPLARVPGPTVCALTGFYEFWWDCVMVGQFFNKVSKMHDKYGTKFLSDRISCKLILLCQAR